jgi:spermidine/putrescine transport system substrate-binding protein
MVSRLRNSKRWACPRCDWLRQSSGAWLAVAAIVLAGLSGCDGGTTVIAPPPTAPVTAPAELNIYNWDTYIDPAVLTDFEQKFGVKIRYDLYESNEAMLESVQAGPNDYDIVVPGDYMVDIMRQADLLAPLNKENIPNFGNVAQAFVSPAYDPGNRYCAPYQWGTLGIGYNVKTTGSLRSEISSWQDLFDPAFAGRVALLADMRLTMGMVLLYLGYSPNTTNADEINEARDFLIAHADQIAAYAPDTGQDLLLSGDVDLAYEWSGDIFQAMEENPDIRYVIPEEGSIIWTDNLCILATAPHKEMAEKFINYVLEPEVGAAISNFVHFGSPNQAAMPLLEEADRNNSALYPSDKVKQRLFFIADVGPDATALYEAAWAEALAAQEQ